MGLSVRRSGARSRAEQKLESGWKDLTLRETLQNRVSRIAVTAAGTGSRRGSPPPDRLPKTERRPLIPLQERARSEKSRAAVYEWTTATSAERSSDHCTTRERSRF